MIRHIAAVALLTISAAAPLAAKSLKAVPVTLDPAKAYLLVEIGPVAGMKVGGQLTLARYDRTNADVRGLGRASGAPLPAKAIVREFTGTALAKDGARRLYLLELEPDFWIVEGANGTAFSLGSSGAAFAAGTVTDLAVAVVANDYGDGEGPYKLTAGKLAKAALLGPLFGGGIAPKPVPTAVTFRARGPNDLALPPALATRTVAVSWSGPFKFGNHLGGLINRMGGRAARTPVTPEPDGATTR